MRPRLDPRPRLRRLAAEARRRPRIDQLDRVRREPVAHRGEVEDAAVGRSGRGRCAVARDDGEGVDRPALGRPFRQAAFEQHDVARRPSRGTSTRRAAPSRGRANRRRRSRCCLVDAERADRGRRISRASAACGAAGWPVSAMASMSKNTAPGNVRGVVLAPARCGRWSRGARCRRRRRRRGRRGVRRATRWRRTSATDRTRSRGASSAKRMRTRRFCLPLLSILPITSRPISAVERTCVPPQGWRSMSPMRTSRTRPVPIGGFTFIVLTRPGLAASSLVGDPLRADRDSRPRPARSAAPRSPPWPAPRRSMSKSSRPSSAPIAPPVTG